MISPVSTIVVDWLLLLVTYLICGARLYVVYSRARSSRKLRRRCDTEIILCTVLAIGTANVCMDTWRNYKLIQFQRRAESGGVDKEEQQEMEIFQMKYIYAQSFVYYVMVWLIKAAFLSTYFHFRGKISKPCRHALYVLTALVAISFVVITLMMFLICLPLERAWSLEPSPKSCSPQGKIWNHSKTAACNILTDLFLIGLFLAILRRTHLGRHERLGVIFFLTVSAVPVLAAILRLVVIVAALKQPPGRLSAAQQGEDVKRFQDVLFLASEVEVTTAFIAACLPAMRALFHQKHETRQCANSHEGKGAWSRGSSGGSGGVWGGNQLKCPPGTPRFDTADNVVFLSDSFGADDHDHHSHWHHHGAGDHYGGFEWGAAAAAEGGQGSTTSPRAHDIELQVRSHSPHGHRGHHHGRHGPSTASGQMEFYAPPTTPVPVHHAYPVDG